MRFFNGRYSIVSAGVFCICLMILPSAEGDLTASPLKIGIYQNSPLSFTDPNGNVMGIYIDILEYIATREGWRIEYTQGSFQECLDRLESGSIDALVAIAYAQERAKKYLFTNETVLSNWGVIYVQGESDTRSIFDLTGKTIAVLKGDVYYTNFHELIDRFEVRCNFIEADSYEAVFELIHAKEADAGIISRLYSARHESRYDVVKTPIVFSPIELRFAFHKNEHHEVIRSIDKHLAALRENKGSIYYQSIDRWLGLPTKGDYPKWILPAFLTMGGLLLLFFGANAFMRSRVKVRTAELFHKTEELEKEIAVRKRTEGQLRESEEKYRLLVDNAEVLVSAYDQDGVCMLMNKAVANLYGGSPENFIGKSLSDLHPEAAEKYAASIVDAIESQTAQGYEDIVQFPSGSRWLLSNVQPLRDADEKVYGAQIISQDITELKKTEEAMKESELKYKILTENSLTGIFIHLDDKFTFVNDRFEQMHGYSPGELLGKNHYDLIHPDQREMIKERSYKRLKGEKVPRRYEIRRLKKDGQSVWHEIIVSDPIAYRGKLAIMGNEIDISDRKRAEDELKTSEERYRALIESVGRTGLAIMVNQDRGGVEAACVFVNDAVEEITGYSGEALAQMSWIDVVHPRYRKLVTDRYRERMNLKDLPGIYEISILDKEGAEISIELISSRTDFQGQMALVTLFRDITQRKRDEEDRKQLEARLRQVQKMEAIGTLAGGIAHDFNNILTALIGYTELALEDIGSNSPASKNLKEVLIAGKRARDLVKQILAFSRRGELEINPIEVAAIAEEAVKLLRSTIPTTIDIVLDLKAGNSTIMGDPTQIHQAILNLSTNAAQAMEMEGGRIEIELENVTLSKGFTDATAHLKPGNYLKFSVTDTGVGISPEIIERIFDPYFTTKEKGKGTGMGLAIVHGIVQSHKGHITVRSIQSQGATFEAFFPLVEKTDARADSPPPEERFAGSEHVLCVDDEKQIVDLQKEGLERLGYTVTPRTSSLEALEAFRADPERYDAVITDMTMPNMTGDRLTHEIKKIRPDIPVVLCTGYSERISKESAKQFKIDAFLMKPVGKTDLAQALRQLLDQPKK